jgi:hypothetical protein
MFGKISYILQGTFLAKEPQSSSFNTQASHLREQGLLWSNEEASVTDEFRRRGDIKVSITLNMLKPIAYIALDLEYLANDC